MILDIRPRRSTLAAIAAASLLAAAPVAAPFCQDPARDREALERDVHRVLGLVDYLRSDYSGAVEGGEVVDETEYEEQCAFADELVELSRGLAATAADGGQGLVGATEGLREAIRRRAPEAEVAAAARRARGACLETFDVKMAPDAPPDLTRGRALYLANCATCHGERGDADTERARELKPPPLSFLGEKAHRTLSPYQTFNVSTFGIAGTSMASFDLLPARDRWDVAFYVAALRHRPPEGGAPEGLTSLSLHELANGADSDLEGRLEELGRDRELRSRDLAWLRWNPQSGAHRDGVGRLARARVRLTRVPDLYRDGRVDEAVRVVMDVYLEGVEPMELSLRSVDANLASRIESRFLSLRRDLRERVPTAAVARSIQALDEDLTLADARLAKGGRPYLLTALASLFILVREGLEAVLLLAAMLALVRKLGRTDAVRVIHGAWVAALAAGLLTWALARWVVSVSAAARELVEGVVGLLASAILAYTSYWILSRADSRRWMEFLRSRISEALGRRGRWTLFGIAFLAVYREAFETVLFYEALASESAGSAAPIAAGFVGGAVLLTGIVFLVFRVAKRLPLKQFFTISGALLYLLAFVFAGNAIHALVEGGYVEARPIAFPTLRWLGVYPDLLGLSLQAAFVAAVAAGLWFDFRAQRRGALT